MTSLRCLIPLSVRRQVREAIYRAIERNQFVAHAFEHYAEHPLFYGPRGRIEIGQGAQVSRAILNANSGKITIGEYAIIGEGVSLLTGTHDIMQFGVNRQRAWPRSGRDILIGEGAWVAAHAVVLGPCVIGSHAVVAAGAVVTRDVEAHTVVAGVPAQLVRRITVSEASGRSTWDEM